MVSPTCQTTANSSWVGSRYARKHHSRYGEQCQNRVVDLKKKKKVCASFQYIHQSFLSFILGKIWSSVLTEPPYKTSLEQCVTSKLHKYATKGKILLLHQDKLLFQVSEFSPYINFSSYAIIHEMLLKITNKKMDPVVSSNNLPDC